MTEIENKWKVTSNEKDVTDALLKTIQCQMMLEAGGKKSQFVRSTKMSSQIAQNVKIRQTLENFIDLLYWFWYSFT